MQTTLKQLYKQIRGLFKTYAVSHIFGANDNLLIRSVTFCEYCFDPRGDQDGSMSRAGSVRRMSDLYMLTPTLLGSGMQGAVYEAIETSTGKRVACKIVPYPFEKAAEFVQHTQNDELEVMSVLGGGNPALMDFKHAFVEGGKLHMFMEKMAGDLCDAVMDRMFSEGDVKRFFYRFLGGLRKMHARGIIHRDVKLDNLFLANSSDICSARLGDFGHALIKGTHRRDSHCGSKEYSAPELLAANAASGETRYDTPVDMWSAGVVLYCVLSREFPFASEPAESLLKAVSTADYGFQGPVWLRLSGDVKDLIRRLLVVDPKKRLSAEQAMEHPWFSSLPEYRRRDASAKGHQQQRKPEISTRPMARAEMLSMFQPIQQMINETKISPSPNKSLLCHCVSVRSRSPEHQSKQCTVSSSL